MAFRSTEITIREVLLDELKARDIRIGHELSTPIPSGRMAPDAVLSNGADYVLETKLGDQSGYFEDLMKLTEWIRLKSVPIRGAFAVSFPKDLRSAPWQQVDKLAHLPKMRYEVSALFRDRPGDKTTGTLVEIADWIAEKVMNPESKKEPNLDFVIRSLSDLVNQLSYRMRGLKASHFEDIFGGKHVFENILEVEPSKMPIENVRKSASYLLINQLIFYHVLSRAEPKHYPPIDVEGLRRPSDLLGYFKVVLDVDYAPTFGFDIASRLPIESIDTVRSVIDIIQAMGIARLQQDTLGKVFHNLIPLSIRKPVAAYYTNKQAGDLLADLSIKSPSDTVIDPSCGSGTLLVASYQRKRRLLELEKRSFTEIDHTVFLENDITGVDIMPFATHLAVVHLSLQSPKFITQKARIGVWDSTDLSPGKVIPSLSMDLERAFKLPTLEMFDKGFHKENARFVRKGAVSMSGVGGEEIRLYPTDVVIMNPPFTSSDHMDASYKESLRKRFGDEYSQYVKGKIGLHGYFILLADRFLKEGGRLAAVIPQTTLTGETFGPIIDFLVSHYTIKAIVVGLGRSAFSENTSLSEILLIAEKQAPVNGQLFALIGTKKNPIQWSQDYIDNIVSSLASQKEYDDSMKVIRWLPQNQIDIKQGGLVHLLPNLFTGYGDLKLKLDEILSSSLIVKYSDLEKILDVKAQISPLGNKEEEGVNGRGGVYFGGSALNISRDSARAIKIVDRLVLTEEKENEKTIKDRVTQCEYNVPLKVIVPSIRRLSPYAHFNASDETDFLISKPFDGLNGILSDIYGESQAKIYTKRIKGKWNKRVEQGLTHLFLERRVDISSSGTHHLAICTSESSFTGRGPWGFHNINFNDSKLLCLWFNSSLFLFQLAEVRTQTRGTWWEISKHKIENTLIPDIRSLSEKQKEELMRLFEALGREDFPSIMEQYESYFQGKRLLDSTWLSILGYPRDQHEAFLDELYAYLSSLLDSLRSAMKED